MRNIENERFGKLVVLRLNDHSKDKRACFICKCDCGNIISCRIGNLISGNTKSCGCIKGKGSITHGMSNTLIYVTWCNIKARCSNPNYHNYKYYGGKGIFVCNEWINDFNSFYNWAIENGYKQGLSIDRIDGNCEYSAKNCRWVNSSVQNKNKSNNIYIEFNGETKLFSEWSDFLGIKKTTLWMRIYKYNWSIEKAFYKK